MAAKKKTSTRNKTASRSPRKAARANKSATASRPARKTTGGLTLLSSGPILTVNDLEASVAFYRDTLGFTEGERWEDNGQLMGVELVAGQVSFMLTQDDWKKGRDRDKGQGVRIYCTTSQSIDALADRIKAKGGRLSHEPRDEEGVRALALEDPDSYKITISTPPKKKKG
jgi:catechol 2,3-dioxygenase-like lactoylglutathione lyase family enzyme